MIRKQKGLSNVTPDLFPTTPPPAKIDKGKQEFEKFVLGAETPLDAKRRRNKPYYSEAYAKDAKAILDKLHTTGQPLRVPCGEFSVNTAALQYYQGSEYLRDHDATGHYVKLFQATKCIREFAHNFLEFRIRTKAHVLVNSVAAAPWKDEFLAFLDNAQEGEKLHRVDVALTADDIAWFNNQCIPLEKLFIFNASHNEILVIRHTEP